jgi:hypothetical protein
MISIESVSGKANGSSPRQTTRSLGDFAEELVAQRKEGETLAEAAIRLGEGDALAEAALRKGNEMLAATNGSGSPQPTATIKQSRKKSSKQSEWWRFPICATTLAKAAREQAQQAGADPDLAEHAAVIRRLSLRCLRDTIEIGRRLYEAKDKVPHGNRTGQEEGWGDWLQREFAWSQDTASNLINVYKLFQEDKFRNVRNLENLNLSVSALYLLARKSTPDAVRDEVMERAEAGENVTAAEVKQLLAQEPVAVADGTPATEEGEEPKRKQPGGRDGYEAQTRGWWNDLLKIVTEIESEKGLAKKIVSLTGLAETKKAEDIDDPKLLAALRAYTDRLALPSMRAAGERQKASGECLIKLADVLEEVHAPPAAEEQLRFRFDPPTQNEAQAA